MKFDLVDSWINTVAYGHSKNESTPYHYRYALKLFCDLIVKTPEQIIADGESLDDKQFRRTYQRYLQAFIGEQSSKGASPNTIRTKVTAVKSFFKYNDLRIAFLPRPKANVKFHNRDITKEEIKAVLGISSIRDKAFFCIMAQTGVRPETLCKLKLKHIEPDFSKGVIPCKINVPKELTKGQYRAYFTFMGEESVKYLKSYLATRSETSMEDYIFTLQGAKEHANPKSQSKIFAASLQKLREKGTINYELRDAKPSELRLYTLRKFFRKYANQAGFEFVQFWMGHIVTSGEEENYRPTDPEFHRSLYQEKAMPFLRFETATPSEFEKVMVEKDQEITALRHDVEELRELVTKQTATMQKLIEKMKLQET